MKIKTGEIRKLVEVARNEALSTAELLKGDSNPQVLETYFRAVGETQAFDAVLEAMLGDAVTLRIFARK